MKSETRPLPVKVDQPTRNQRGVELAEKTKALEEALEARTRDNKAHNAEIKEIREEVKTLAGVVRSGVEIREVPVRWEPDYKATPPEKRLIRTDTGAVVETERLSDDERQTHLDDVTSRAKAKARKKAGKKTSKKRGKK